MDSGTRTLTCLSDADTYFCDASNVFTIPSVKPYQQAYR